MDYGQNLPMPTPAQQWAETLGLPSAAAAILATSSATLSTMDKLVAWLKAHSTEVYIIAGSLAALAVLGGAKRR